MIKQKTKKAFTLIEIMVSLGIFTIVITLAIASFVSIMNLDAMGANMSNSQQKVRVAVEQISRLARQADKVELGSLITGTNPPASKTLKLYFNITQASQSAIEFIFYSPSWNTDSGTLYIYNCARFDSNNNCNDPNWTSSANPSSYAQDLFAGINNKNILKLVDTGTLTNQFSILPLLPPTLSINLAGQIPTTSTRVYYNDNLKINTEVIMDNLQ